MCGISGIVSNNPSEINLQTLAAMTKTLAHRGPDGENFWINEEKTIGLGHRRLAIIDLSSSGNQPMHYRNRFTIIFNGEIYNYIELKKDLEILGHKFHSHSDTEVLLALYTEYGESCLQKVDGMFAFAIYDRDTHKLFCARDRFGEKPFYYYYEPGRKFCFASEMKSLWSIGVSRQTNGKMLYNYLTRAHLQNPTDASETFYRDIVQLKPAHFITLNTRQFTLSPQKPYWTLQLSTNIESNEDKLKEKLLALMTESVKRRLRSDVAVGTSLSGGIDSSIVVKTIDEIKNGTLQIQRTFSARFPGHFKDEGKYMDMVIAQCRVEPHFTYPNSQTIIDNLEKIFYHQEEPFETASVFAQYAVMKLARENGVIVMLDGQGADEILAGYHKYFNTYFSELKHTNPAKLREERNNYLTLFGKSQINPVERKHLSYYAKNYAPGPFKMAEKIRNYYRQLVKPELTQDFYRSFNKQEFPASFRFKTLNESLLFSTTHVGLEQLLRYADRNSMAHSLEVRLPFLSHELVEFLFSLPSEYKIRHGWTKWILRSAYTNKLPNAIIWRKDKIGYEPPKDNWMTDKKVREMIRTSQKKLINAGILNKKILEIPVSKEDQNKIWVQWMSGNLL